MIVRCDDEECRHNEDGICNNPSKEISMVLTLGGQVICSDQIEVEEEEDG